MGALMGVASVSCVVGWALEKMNQKGRESGLIAGASAV